MNTLLNILKTLLKGPKTINELTEETGKSRPQLYRQLKNLEDFGIVRIENGRAQYADTPEALAVKKIALNYSRPDLLLRKKHLQILQLLAKRPLTTHQLAQITGIPPSTLRRIIKQLQASGYINTRKRVHSLAQDPDLYRAVETIGQKILAKELEPYAIPVYTSPTLVIKKVPKGEKASGTPTAFTLFPKYGVHVETPWDYYATPPGDQSPEEALVHALLAAETRYERALAALFYAKNRYKINFNKALRLARHTPALRLLLELPAYIAGQPIETHEQLLPWNEFKELAQTYGIKVSPSTTLQLVEKYFQEVGKKLRKHTTAYVFGGLNLLALGIKPATKDIDLIVENRDTFNRLIQALKESGYSFPTGSAKPRHIAILVKDSLRVDLYLAHVYDIKLTIGMKQRAKKAIAYGKLLLKLLSIEDTVLLKAVAGRHRDIEDIALTIRKKGIDWNTLLQALNEQGREIAEKHAQTILETLETLEDAYNIKVPRKIKQHLKNLAETHIVKQALKLGYKTPQEISEQTGLPVAKTRKILQKLIQEYPTYLVI